MNCSKIYISTIAPDGTVMAKAHGFGLEIAEYCTAWNMDEKYHEVHPKVLETIEGIHNWVLHAPFNELFPCVIDKKAQALAACRYRQAIDLAKLYGASKVVIHGGYNRGLYGAAVGRKPVVIDGFISTVAALCACRMCPEGRGYLIPSHASFEIGYKLAMDAMGLQPLFLLGMRLGEGSGCPLAFEVLSAACAIMNDMATFEAANIDDGYLDEIRRGDKFTVEGAT